MNAGVTPLSLFLAYPRQHRLGEALKESHGCESVPQTCRAG